METARGQSDRQALQALQSALGAQYTLERELGRGGMATVYLAHDVRHGRKVAVKLLHPELAAVLGAARFLAEIRTTAALQHPHILPLFDSGEAAGQLYYVMPYVEGETLRTRLARERQLAVADAVRLASEVASALDYAHRHGVIHRDIKPENILLGDDGQALVADFGIALAMSHAGGERMTQSGLSLGTPQYMSPEQAEADRALDARTDVYALGAVTYEMLAGEPPFTGPSAQAIIAKLMTEEPRPLGRVRRSVPPHVEATVHRALEKLPADRFPSAGTFAAALVDPALTREYTTAHVAVADRSRRRFRAGAGLLVAGLAIGAAASRVTLGASRTTSPRGPVRFEVRPDSGLLDAGNWWSSTPAISPDGRTIVYAVSGSGWGQLYARKVDDVVPHPIPGTEGGDVPFFSPDGASVAFSANGGRTIRKVRLDGGTPVLVADLPAEGGSFLNGTWAPSDTIYFGTFTWKHVLYRVPAAGGTPTTVPLVDTTYHLLHPFALPGGRVLLVTATPEWRVGRLAVLDLTSGRLRRFGPGTGAHYVGGDIVWASASGAIYRQPFDLRKLEPSGTPEEIANGLDVHYAAFSPFDVSANGSLVYRVGHGSWRMALVDREGRELKALSDRFPWSPRFSHDGRRIAYSALTPGQQGEDMWSGDVWHTDILITDLASGAVQRLTTDGNDDNEPVWSPDDRSIAFDAGRLGTKDVFVRRLDGDSARLLVRRSGNQFTTDWSPDGSAVLFSDPAPGIWLQPVNGDTARPYVTGPGAPNNGAVSPDGHWIAYSSNELGRLEVYVQSYPTPGRRVLVSSGGGTRPSWRHDGRELYYVQGDQLFAASLEPRGPSDPPLVRSRTLLFRAPIVGDNYAVSPDGTRFVIVTGGPRESHLVVALDALDSRPR